MVHSTAIHGGIIAPSGHYGKETLLGDLYRAGSAVGLVAAVLLGGGGNDPDRGTKLVDRVQERVGLIRRRQA